MANLEHIDILKKGANYWNDWRDANPKVIPDLSGFDMTFPIPSCPDLNGINLRCANLSRTTIHGPDKDWPGDTAPSFNNADLRNADLSHTDCFRTSFNSSNLEGSVLKNGKFRSVGFLGSNLRNADLSNVDMDGVGLEGASLIQSNLNGAKLINCRIYGISAWDILQDNKTLTRDLTINEIYKQNTPGIFTRTNTPILTVDGLEIAQFIYLVLNNSNLRTVLNLVTTKVVLILGRFSNDERKKVLNSIRNKLREYNYIPVMFDFEGSYNRDLTETISTLAHLSKFIIADITDAKSIPQELQVIVPHLPSVIVQPILAIDYMEYAMFEHFQRYPWVMPIFYYKSNSHLLECLKDEILAPIELRFQNNKT
ncbi:MAG: pentapeptide repeat-containing protein [Ferruginibacter sp.]